MPGGVFHGRASQVDWNLRLQRVISGQHAKETGYVLEADISWSGKDDKP